MAKVALITGSAVRLGDAIARHLAEDQWDIALHYRESSAEISNLETELKQAYPDQRFITFKADLGNMDHIPKLIKLVTERFGQLDLLINNAAVFEPSTLKETSDELLTRQTMVNYMAPFILIRDFAINASKGLIINLVDARIANNKSDHLAYSLSKKSLWELTKSAALELAPFFRVNAIAPGAILPPAGKDIHYLKKIASKTPMKVPSGIDAVLRSIDFIIKNEDLTGQLIFCDGGAHLL